MNVAAGSGTSTTLNASAPNCAVSPAPVRTSRPITRATRAARVPAVAVAVKSALSDPARVTLSDCAPSVVPSRHRTRARPLASVTIGAALTLPPPEVTVTLRAPAASGRPAPSRARTTSESVSTSPCSAVCVFPDTTRILGRTETATVMPSESAPYEARTVVAPPPTAVTRPAVSTRATSVSSDENLIGIDGSRSAAVPVRSYRLALIRAVSVGERSSRDGVTRMLRGFVSGPASGPVMIPLQAITPAMTASTASGARSARRVAANRLSRIRSCAPTWW